jgi:hypothetical protein
MDFTEILGATPSATAAAIPIRVHSTPAQVLWINVVSE